MCLHSLHDYILRHCTADSCTQVTHRALVTDAFFICLSLVTTEDRGLNSDRVAWNIRWWCLPVVTRSFSLMRLFDISFADLSVINTSCGYDSSGMTIAIMIFCVHTCIVELTSASCPSLLVLFWNCRCPLCRSVSSIRNHSIPPGRWFYKSLWLVLTNLVHSK